MNWRIIEYFILTVVMTLALLHDGFADLSYIDPESERFSSERLTRISSVMQAEIDKDTMPGAVTLIARNGRIVHFQAHGFLDPHKSRPMSTDSVFRIFSMTKPLVSVAAMILVEQGRMQLADPISIWIPELGDMKVLVEKKDAMGNTTYEKVPAVRPITVHDLLRHTSGFTYADFGTVKEVCEAYVKADIESVETDVSPEEFIQRLAQIPLAYQPGTRWEYSISTNVLGVLLERMTGKRLDVLLDTMILQPLQMKDTSFQIRPDQKTRLAEAFDHDPLKARFWKSSRVMEDPGRRYRRGDSGAVSTAEDYFRFAQMILNGGELEGVRILSPKTVAYMLSDHIPGFPGSTAASTGPGYGFGLGFGVRLQDGLAVVPGSKGDVMWAGAGGTSFTIDPKEEIVAIFMAQAPSTRLHTRFLFKNLLYGALVR